MSDLFVLELLYQGRKKLQEEHDVEEKTKLGTFRVGSGGVLLSPGSVTGTCPRLAVGRYFGVNRPTDDNRLLMFAAGLANEDITVVELEKALAGTAYSIKRETDVPIKWATTKGTEVSGRPDIVLCKADTPELGLELKLVSSLWTARDVFFKRQPKALHLIQAGHYSWKLGVPFELHYTSRADYQVPTEKWAQPHFQTANELLVERNERNLVKKVLPHNVAYRLDWDGESLVWMDVEKEGWKPTLITKKGIEGYFDLLDDLIATKKVGPRPAKIDALGEEMHYDVCSGKYCAFSGICDTCSRSLDQWLDAAKQLTTKE